MPAVSRLNRQLTTGNWQLGYRAEPPPPAPKPASRSGCGRAITCEATSSPTRPAASAPASTAAFTLPTSPRTMVVTNAPPIWIVFTTSTLAALVIASVASTSATQPLVSIIPSACPYAPLPFPSGMVFSMWHGRLARGFLASNYPHPNPLPEGEGTGGKDTGGSPVPVRYFFTCSAS